MLVIGLVAAGIWWWATGDDGNSISAPVDDSPEAVPFAAAIPTVYQVNTNTLFLVDISGSIAESGNLKPMRTALASIALGDVRPDIHTAAENSQAALMTFGVGRETPIALGGLQDEQSRNLWLATAGNLQTEKAGGTLIYDAVAEAHEMLLANNGGDNVPVIVLLSDGIDGDVGECRPATAEEIRSTLYCVGEGGYPVLCDDLPGGGRHNQNICEIIPSDADPEQLLTQLANKSKEYGLIVHTIGYGSPKPMTG